MKGIKWVSVEAITGKFMVLGLAAYFVGGAALAATTSAAALKAKYERTLPMVGGDVAVEVKGVAIPFTSFGIVHRLKTVPGVVGVQFNLKQGEAILQLAPNAYVTDSMLRAAVKNASYTPGNVKWLSETVQREHEVKQEAAESNPGIPGSAKQEKSASKQKN